MSRPSLNERLGIISAGIVLVVVAATMLFYRGRSDAPASRPVPVAITDTVRVAPVQVEPAATKPKPGKDDRRGKGRKGRKGKKPQKTPKNATAPRSPLDEC